MLKASVVKEFDGCEYVVNSQLSQTHKGNCKFCFQRRMKENLDLLIIIDRMNQGYSLDQIMREITDRQKKMIPSRKEPVKKQT